MDAPERIWLDPELVDSPRKTLACNFATATREHSLPTDVQYIRADLIEAQAAQLQEAREALEEIVGVGFDAPMTWSCTDEEWERRRANIMQGIARAFIAK
jgi:hypothetical protein